MVRLKLSVELRYEVFAPGGDFVFNVHAARTRQQHVVSEMMELGQLVLPRIDTDPATATRYMRLRAQPGPLWLRYGATVDIAHHFATPDALPEVAIAQLPASALIYLYPSRYCQSDQLHAFALQTFGALPPGYGRVARIRDWVQAHVAFKSNSSDSRTSALDTLRDRAGVCRDFAHLMIALCRAVNIPARFVTGIDFGADPAMGPQDFHACVEVFLGDRWFLFDPSGVAVPMGFMRFGCGRDAADVPFATIIGPVAAQPPKVAIEALAVPGGELPWRCGRAISTDDGLAAA